MKHRLSPGTVLGVVAIVLACAGSATAGSLITGAQIKNGSVTGLDIKQGSVQRADLAPNARKGKAGLAGPQGPAGPKGDTGPAGTSPSSSYAHVNADGTLDAAHTKGVGSVQHPQAGRYCFYGLAGSPKNVDATLDVQGPGSATRIYGAIGADDPATGGCPGAEEGQVELHDSSGDEVDDAFYVAFN